MSSRASFHGRIAQSNLIVRPYIRPILAFCALSLLAGVAESVGIGLFVPLISLLASSRFPGESPAAVGRLMEAMQWLGIRELWQVCFVLIGVILVKNALVFSAGWLNGVINARAIRDLQRAVLDQWFRVDYEFIVKQDFGCLVDLFFRRIHIAASVLQSALSLVRGALQALLYVALLLVLSWQLTLMAVAFGLVVGVMNNWAVRGTRRLARGTLDLEGRVSHTLHGVLSGLRLVRAYGREAHEEARIRGTQDALYRIRVLQGVFKNVPGPVGEVVAVLALSAILVLGSRLYGATAIGSLGAFVLVLIRLLPQVSVINSGRTVVASEYHNVEALLDFLDHRDKPYMRNGSRIFSGLREAIRFERVSFRYPVREDATVSDITLSIPVGRVTAIVGESGSGKSTMLDLLLRLYDPTSGGILVNGVDLREYDVCSWRSRIGVVSQDGFAFSASVRENIAYGKLDATDAEIERAAQQANADEFIRQLPDGYETLVGERGVLLSGGQRQRIAIARAILRDPDILILDEATSALDTVTERLIQREIMELAKGRTVVIVAHRLTTIEHADRIVVLDGGRLVEEGIHAELLARNGRYRELYGRDAPMDHRHAELPGR